jgi:hypothetical protein
VCYFTVIATQYVWFVVVHTVCSLQGCVPLPTELRIVLNTCCRQHNACPALGWRPAAQHLASGVVLINKLLFAGQQHDLAAYTK